MSTIDFGLRERGQLRRRERILDATRELLRERADQAITIETIVEGAEVAKATVFDQAAVSGVPALAMLFSPGVTGTILDRSATSGDRS